MSDNDEKTKSSSSKLNKASWTIEAELELLLQVMKQLLKLNEPVVKISEIAIEGRTPKSISQRWATLKKKAQDYDASDVTAGIPRKSPKAYKKVTVEDEVELETPPPKKKARVGSGVSSKATETTPVRKARKKTDGTGEDSDAEAAEPPPAPKKIRKYPRAGTSGSANKQVEEESEDKKDAEEKAAPSVVSNGNTTARAEVATEEEIWTS